MQDDLMRKLAVGASSLALCLGASAGVAWACDGQGGPQPGDDTSASDEGPGSTTDSTSTDTTSTDGTQTAAAKRRAAKRRAARRAAARRRHARHA